jgi:hypothetical protein
MLRARSEGGGGRSSSSDDDDVGDEAGDDGRTSPGPRGCYAGEYQIDDSVSGRCFIRRVRRCGKEDEGWSGAERGSGRAWDDERRVIRQRSANRDVAAASGRGIRQQGNSERMRMRRRRVDGRPHGVRVGYLVMGRRKNVNHGRVWTRFK